MKAHLKLWQAALLIALCACSQRDYLIQQVDLDNDRDNAYMQTWIKKFNVPASDQNWCMLRAVTAEIATATIGEGVTTTLYSDSPATGGHMIGVATGDCTLRFDLKKGVSSIYAEVTDANGDVLSAGTYTIEGESVRIDGSAADGDSPTSRYAHDTTNGRSWFHAMIACEDLGTTSRSDFDFNDIVFGLQHVAGTKTLTVTPLASGGTIPANISITIGDKTYDIGESHNLIHPGAPTTAMLNTENPFKRAGASVNITLPSSSWTITDAWANKEITITVEGAGLAYELTPVSEGKAPKMICLGGDWYWPVESLPIDEAYPGFTNWAQGDASLTSWVDKYSSIDDVVAWQWSQVSNNWFSATSTGAEYDARINDSRTVTVNTDERYYMYPATSAREMFRGRTDLTAVNITGDHFNTESVTTTLYMFDGCTGLTSIDLSNWNTSKLASPYHMFVGCESLETINLSGWDFRSFKGYYHPLADNCPNLTKLILNNAIITRAIGYVDQGQHEETLFAPQKSTLTEIEAENCTISGTDMSYLFQSYSALEKLDIRSWDVSAVTTMRSMFSGCSSLQSMDLRGWDISKVTSTESLFSGLQNATEINIDGWNTASLQNASFMFQNCKLLTSLDFSSWDTSKLNYARGLVDGCELLESLDLSGWRFDRIKNASNESYRSLGTAPALKYLKIDGATLTLQMTYNSYRWASEVFDDFDNLQTISAKNCKSSGTTMAYGLAYLHNLETIDLSNLLLGENMTDMSSFFYNCESLGSVDLSNCDMSHVTDLNSMFYGCRSLTSITGLKDWNVTSVTNAKFMFYNCSSLTSLDLSDWDTSNIDYARAMVAGCEALESLDLSGWHLERLKDPDSYRALGTAPALKYLKIDGATIISSMTYTGYRWSSAVFQEFENLQTISAKNCKTSGTTLEKAFAYFSKLESIDLSGLQLGDVTTLNYMFSSCSQLKEVDLTGCDFSGVTSVSGMFSGCNSLEKITCSSATKSKIESTIPSSVTVEWVIVD